jgi:hypothetical protein
MTHYDRGRDGECYPRQNVPDAVAQKGGNKTERAQHRAIRETVFRRKKLSEYHV